VRTRTKVLIGAGILIAALVILGVAFPSSGKNSAYQPQEEFKLVPWINLKLGPIDMSINKAVLYLFLASVLTILTMTFIARRMQAKPNRIQTAMEVAYGLMRTIRWCQPSLVACAALSWAARSSASRPNRTSNSCGGIPIRPHSSSSCSRT